MGQNNRMTLTRIVANGARVSEGDLIAEFDALEQIDAARGASAKQEDLEHQVQQKAAQNRADAEKRRSDVQQADAALRKAQLEIGKAEILPEIDKQQNRIRAEIAQKHLDSLKVSQAEHDRVDAAALHILELQRDRQKVALDRAQNNMKNLQVKAPLAGMVAHSVQYRNGSITHVQEGDQLYRGNALVSIFDPSEMLVRCSVAEPDRVELRPGARATVYVDAYPDLALPAHFESASPIATTALGSPIKTFTALFKLDRIDPRLMPDLSAAVVVETGGGTKQATKGKQ
jgi:multidrug resistance efflux pump